MTCAPDILPAFGTALAGADIDVLADIDRAALRQIVRIESGGLDRRPQHVGLQSRERRRQQDIVGRAGNQQLLVSDIRHALARGDEFCAHIGEIAAERLAPRASAWPSVMPPASTNGPSKNARTARTNTNGLSQPVWPPAPAVSSTSPSAPAGNRTLGMADRGDIGKHQRAGIMQRPDHRRRRSDRGDHHFGPVPQQHLQILLQPRIGAMHDQVGADRCRRFAACIRMRLQPDVDIRQPLVQLFGTAAVHRRETNRSRRCGRRLPQGLRRRRETSVPRSAAG